MSYRNIPTTQPPKDAVERAKQAAPEEVTYGKGKVAFRGDSGYYVYDLFGSCQGGHLSATEATEWLVTLNPKDEPVKRGMVYCKNCGGTNVQIAGWIDPNCPTTYFGDFGSFGEKDSSWCMDCEKHGTLAVAEGDEFPVGDSTPQLKHFGTPGEVLDYIMGEIVATLEDDLDQQDEDDPIREELANKVHDIQAIQDLVTLKQDWVPRRKVVVPSSEPKADVSVICTDITVTRRIANLDEEGNLIDMTETDHFTPDIDPSSVAGSTVEENLADVERRIVDWCEETLAHPEQTTRERWACFDEDSGRWSCFLATQEDLVEVTLSQRTSTPATTWE